MGAYYNENDPKAAAWLRELIRAGNARTTGRGEPANLSAGSGMAYVPQLGIEPAHAPEALWGASDWLHCRDEKWRPVEPGTFPLAHGVPARVGRLRGYGNAIVPEVAAEVIRAYLEGEP